MRAGIGLVLALAASAAGCRALGLYEETAKDMSDLNTRAGAMAVDIGTTKIKVVKFEPDFKTAPGSVKLELLNEGDPQEFVSFDLEFGYPAPPESFSPYTPEFVEVPFADWKKGETKTPVPNPVPGAVGQADRPLFARIVSISGTDVRRTAAREPSDHGLRRGTMFLGGKVEVVKIAADLAPKEGTKATMSFTLESNEEKADVGNLRYMVQFYKDGKPLDLGRSLRIFKPAPKALGKKGDQVVVDVSLDWVPGLAVTQPVLRVIQ
jgi:hypothetical protein